MIILDTNVISEIMRGERASSAVMMWLRGLDGPPATTVVNRAEISAGLHNLPDGAGARALTAAAQQAFAQIPQCLPLTVAAADHYGEIVAARKRSGRPIATLDALIAAIARQSDGTLATRNIDDFNDLRVLLVNPWDQGREAASSGLSS